MRKKKQNDARILAGSAACLPAHPCSLRVFLKIVKSERQKVESRVRGGRRKNRFSKKAASVASKFERKRSSPREIPRLFRSSLRRREKFSRNYLAMIPEFVTPREWLNSSFIHPDPTENIDTTFSENCPENRRLAPINASTRF